MDARAGETEQPIEGVERAGPPARRWWIAAVAAVLVPCAVAGGSVLAGLSLHPSLGVAALVLLVAALATGAGLGRGWHVVAGACAFSVTLACVASAALAGGDAVVPAHALLGKPALLLLAPLWIGRLPRWAHSALGKLALFAAVGAVVVMRWP